jgi:hypothetical protein
MKRSTVGLVLLLALAACDQKAGQKSGLPMAEAAKPGATTPPVRKPGLWEQRVSNSEMVQVSRVCIDAEVDKRLSWWGAQTTKGACEKNLVTGRAEGGWQFSSVCEMGSGGRTTTSGVVTGDFGSHYQVAAESSTTGAAAPQMNGPHKLTIDATWQGACPAGTKPGDMSLPGGVKINLLDLG